MASVLTGSYQGRYLKLTVVEESYSILNNTSTVRWTLESIGGSSNYYSIYKWGVVINGQTIYPTQNTEWDTYTFPAKKGSSTGTITIQHNSDGTAPDVSFILKGSVYYNQNKSYSGSISLTPLHTPPAITNIAIEETNSSLTSISVPNNKIVQFLSKKKFTITTTLYDGATLSNCSVYHNNVLIGTASSNIVNVNFNNVGELMTTVSSGTYYVALTIVATDSMGGSKSQIVNYQVIKYTKPTIESTSSTIKRKTGDGTVLSDNKANLNFVGTAYKGNDVVGNNNTPTVKYKVWTTTEPSYTSVSSTASGNNITVTNYQINNVIYTSVYNYKIEISDSFGNYANKQDKIPTGTSVWTEYRDRVDFLKLQVGGVDVPMKSTDLETVLYNDPSGSNGDIVLSSSAANYTYIEIFYYENNKNGYNSTKIYSPNGKKISLNINAYYVSSSNLYQYFYTKIINISGTSLTVEKNTELRIYNDSVNNHTTDNRIYITRVVGVK